MTWSALSPSNMVSPEKMAAALEQAQSSGTEDIIRLHQKVWRIIDHTAFAGLYSPTAGKAVVIEHPAIPGGQVHYLERVGKHWESA